MHCKEMWIRQKMYTNTANTSLLLLSVIPPDEFAYIYYNFKIPDYLAKGNGGHPSLFPSVSFSLPFSLPFFLSFPFSLSPHFLFGVYRYMYTCVLVYVPFMCSTDQRRTCSSLPIALNLTPFVDPEDHYFSQVCWPLSSSQNWSMSAPDTEVTCMCIYA